MRAKGEHALYPRHSQPMQMAAAKSYAYICSTVVVVRSLLTTTRISNNHRNFPFTILNLEYNFPY